MIGISRIMYAENNQRVQELYDLPKYVKVSGHGLVTGKSLMLADRLWQVDDGRWIVVKDRHQGEINVDANLTDIEKMIIILSAG